MYDQETKDKHVSALKEALTALRAEVLSIEKKVRELKGVIPALAHNTAVDMPELAANITLAFRHLEDARMRLGKSVQALEGGVSIFDKPVRTEDYHHPTV